MKNKRRLFAIFCVVIVFIGALFIVQIFENLSEMAQAKTNEIAVQSVSSQILVNGVVTPQTQVTLHFQAGGKLVYLPFQLGSNISAGQTIAQLDTYQLQRALSAALNNYRSTRDQFDQTQVNVNNNYTQNQQKGQLNFYSAGIGSDSTAYNYLNDVAKRILDENQASLDNSVINVEIANNALQLSTLTSPISGVITQEDVTVAGVNVTPQTGFTVVDPSSLVFRANIEENDIDFVKIGAPVTVQINGIAKPVDGIVSKIYPNKQFLQNGQSVYQVDITIISLPQLAKMDQTGIALITTSATSSTKLIPTWTVLNHQYVWVEENQKPVLKKVQVGQEHGDMTEILSGLSSSDTIIVNPAAIAVQKYQLLSL